MAVSKPLGIRLKEIEDWNCCGATNIFPAHDAGYALIARNLALLKNRQRQPDPHRPLLGLLPQPGQSRPLHAGGQGLWSEDQRIFSGRRFALYSRKLAVRHLLDVVLNEVGLDKVKEKVVKPLSGLRVAPYLGCMLPVQITATLLGYRTSRRVRQPAIRVGSGSSPLPAQRRIARWAHDADWADTAFEMIRRLVAAADQQKADAIITVCRCAR